MSLEVTKDTYYHILSKSIHLEQLTDGPVDANGMSHIGKKQVWNISVTFYHIFSSIHRSWREWTGLYRHSVKASQFINSEIRVLLEELTVSTASQIPRLLCNPKVRKSLQSDCTRILGHMNPVHTLKHYFLKPPF
jgi:hypothetical protein